jgi:hypothetical protein
MIKATILIPKRDNAGLPFDRRTLQAFEARFADLAEGFSITRDVEGVRRYEGTTYVDRSDRYEMAMADWDGVAPFLELARWARVWFRQEAIYIEIAGIPQIISG